MDSTVRREILDNSITGEKIFGGSIDWIESLFVDQINVPHQGSDGTGFIDGVGVYIGALSPIGSLSSYGVFASDRLEVKNDNGLEYLFAGFKDSNSDFVLSLKNDNSSEEVRFITGASDYDCNYFLRPLAIGKRSLDFGGLYGFEVFSMYSGSITCEQIICEGVGLLSSQTYVYDSSESIRSMTSIIDDVDEMSSVFLSSGSIKEPWNTLNNLTQLEATQLLNINSNIINITSWGRVAEMHLLDWTSVRGLNQNCSTTSSPTFITPNVQSIRVGSNSSSYQNEIYKKGVSNVDIYLRSENGTELAIIEGVDISYVRNGRAVTIKFLDDQVSSTSYGFNYETLSTYYAYIEVDFFGSNVDDIRPSGSSEVGNVVGDVSIGDASIQKYWQSGPSGSTVYLNSFAILRDEKLLIGQKKVESDGDLSGDITDTPAFDQIHCFTITGDGVNNWDVRLKHFSLTYYLNRDTEDPVSS